MTTYTKLRSRLDGVVGGSNSGWDLKKKVNLYVNPEAKCPYCEGWFHTNRIWLVNNNNNYLRGCWNLDGSEIKDGLIIHPHVWMSGEVCLGTLKTASDALFAGIDKGKHVHYVPRWLVQLGHECSWIPYNDCPVCNKKYLDDVEIWFGFRSTRVCSNDCWNIAKIFRCENCSCEIDMYQKRFCEECDEELHSSCEICSERIFEADCMCFSRDSEHRCCYDCYRTLKSCVGCGTMEQVSDLNTQRICAYCVDNPSYQCIECAELYSNPDDLEDGLCSHCNEFCNECECSPCECEPESYLDEPEEEEEDEYEEESDGDSPVDVLMSTPEAEFLVWRPNNTDETTL